MTQPSKWQLRMMWLALTGLAFAVLVALVAGVVWGLARVLEILSPVLWPLAVAGVLAYLLDPLVDLIERRGPSRPRAILCVFAVALATVVLVVSSILPPLAAEVRQLTERVPLYAAKTASKIEQLLVNPPSWVKRFLEWEAGRNAAASATGTNALPAAQPAIMLTNANPPTVVTLTNAPAASPGGWEKVKIEEQLQAAATWVAKALPAAGQWLAGRIASSLGVLAGLVLIPVYTFYFLLEKQGISSRWTNYLPVSDSRFKEELVFVLNSINNYLITFFRGQVLVAISDGILYGLGFLIIGLPYALLIGAMAMVITMIPFLGAIVTCITALILALVTFGDWLHPVLVLLVFGVVQALEGLVISPKIMGGRVGLHPLTIIVAVMAGTTLLGGLLGGLLAIPLTAVLRVLMFRYVWKRDPEPAK